MSEGTESRGHGAVAAFAGVAGFLALIQFVTLGSAALGLRLGTTAAAAATAASCVLAVLFALRFAGGAPPRAPGASGGTTDALSWLARVMIGAALVWAALVWARLWLLAAQRPPYDWDGLYYHVPALHGWALRGRVAWLGDSPDVPFVNFPMGIEATTFLAHRLLGATRLVTACNLWYWPLGILALVVIAGRLGASGPWRWLAGALLAAVPVFVCQSATCYTDPGFASTVMAALAASLLLVFHDGRRVAAKTLLWGASVGVMAGAKGTGAPFALILAAAVLAAAVWVHGAREWRRWLLRIGVAALVAFAVGGYWYARAALRTGNPISPIQLRLGAKVLREGYDHVAFSEANLPAWLARHPPALRMPVSWLQLDAPIHGYAPVGGMGYLWPAAALPAIAGIGIGALRRRSGRPAKEFALLAALVLLLLAVQASPWWARFTIWLHALGLPCLAVVLQRGFSASRVPVRVLAVAGLLAVIGIGVWESERTLAIERSTGLLSATGSSPATYRTSQEMIFPGMAATPGFDRFLAASKIARSPWGRLGTLLGGVLAMPLGRREIAVLPAAPAAADLARLRKLGIAWVLWDVAGAGPVPAIIEENAGEAHAYAPGPDADFRVLRLDAAAAP